MFMMTDEKGRDAKVLCVPATDPRWQQLRDVDDVPAFLREEIAHFFAVYKAIEPGKGAESEGWRDNAAAEAEVEAARARLAAGSAVLGDPGRRADL
jgi:inorganic pyrophosphatase